MEQKSGMQMNEKAGEKVVILRVKAKHPAKRFQLGRHKIGAFFAKYKLNAAEQKELNTDGPKAWLEVGTDAKMKDDARLHGSLANLGQEDSD